MRAGRAAARARSSGAFVGTRSRTRAPSNGTSGSCAPTVRPRSRRMQPGEAQQKLVVVVVREPVDRSSLVVVVAAGDRYEADRQACHRGVEAGASEGGDDVVDGVQ